MAFSVLFVCTGNTCRSPMAAGLLTHLLPEGKKARYRALSAGTLAAGGEPASEGAVAAMRELGADLSSHRSQPLSPALLEKADLILGVSAEHVKHIRDNFPEAAGKTFLLSEYADKAGPGADIPDPVGRPLEAYRGTRDTIRGYVEKIIRKM